MCTTSVRNQSPSWWDPKLRITWARDIVRPVVLCRPTRGRFGPPVRNLVGVIKCAFQSAMCGGDRVVRVPSASSINVRCQFGKGGGDGPFDTQYVFNIMDGQHSCGHPSRAGPPPDDGHDLLPGPSMPLRPEDRQHKFRAPHSGSCFVPWQLKRWKPTFGLDPC